MTQPIDRQARTQTYTAENMIVTAGGPASDVARIQLVLLDQQEDAASASRRSSQNSAKLMRKAQVGEMRRAADMQLAAGLTRAATAMVGAAIDYAAASRGDDAADLQHDAGTHQANATALGSSDATAGARANEQRTANFENRAASGIETDAKQLQSAGKGLEAGGQALGAVFDHAAAKASAQATEYGGLADGYQQDAEAAGEAASQAARRSERMMEALAQVANARAEAVRNAVG